MVLIKGWLSVTNEFISTMEQKQRMQVLALLNLTALWTVTLNLTVLNIKKSVKAFWCQSQSKMKNRFSKSVQNFKVFRFAGEEYFKETFFVSVLNIFVTQAQQKQREHSC